MLAIVVVRACRALAVGFSLSCCTLFFDGPTDENVNPGGADDGGAAIGCGPNTCAENQICNESEDDPLCECKPGYDGPECQNDIDDCFAAPCANDGVCVDRVSGFECFCTDDWSGELCTCPNSILSLLDIEPAGASNIVDLQDVTISAPGGQVFVGSTFGVLGGFGDHLVDGSDTKEQLEFVFAKPATGIVIGSNIVGTGGSGQAGAVEIDAFDGAGASLGAVEMMGTGLLSLHSVYGDTPIKSFTLTATTAGFRGLSSLKYTLQCP